MPVLKNNGVICHFAHIPKCGGSSIERYCRDAGATIAFLDERFTSHPAAQPWNVSSPQHVDGASLARLFTADFFDFGIAVVRDPVERFLSAFKFQMLVEKKIPLDYDVNEFVARDLERITNSLGEFDNHFMPQVKFFLPGLDYTVFNMRNGLGPVKAFLDERLFGASMGLDIGHVNKGRSAEELDGSLQLDDRALAVLARTYSCDYKILGFQDAGIMTGKNGPGDATVTTVRVE